MAAIVIADVVGYSHHMERDPTGTRERFLAIQKDLIEPILAAHQGRVVNTMGDAFLIEFNSVVSGVEAAVQFQRRMAELDQPAEAPLQFRIGVNLGEIIVEGDDIHGEGINVAARLEALAEPGGIVISGRVHEQLHDDVDVGFEFMGEQQVKNVDRLIRTYKVLLDPADSDKRAAPQTQAKKPAPPYKVIAAALVVLALMIGGGLWWWQSQVDFEPADPAKMVFKLPEKPSIAVLPFDNLSNDPKQDFIADGLTETIITELSRFSGLFVIARNSVFTYKGKPMKVRQVAEELGVQYVLEGSVQRSTDTMRITAQLIDATSGAHLWAQRYDRKPSDIFAVQDEVTAKIVASLGAYQGELAEAGKKRAKRKNTDNLTAYEAFLLGIEQKHLFSRENNAAAERLFNKALQIDPQFAQAYVGLAWVHIQKVWFGWSDAPDRDVARTLEAAKKAVALDPSEAEAHWLLAEAYMSNKEFEKARAEFDRALSLNSNNADLLAGWGYARVLLGEPENAAASIKKAMRLNPHYPDWYDRAWGTAAYMARRHEDAVVAFKKVTQHVIQSRLYLTASYAQLGRPKAARAEVAEAIKLDPEISVEKFSSIETYKNSADLEYLRDGLRRAGLPEKPPSTKPKKPSIAVLPFANLSDDKEQEYFADGMTDDLITDLSKVSGLIVISRNSVFTYKGKAVKVQEVAKDLNVTHVLEGSVRRAGGQVRINAQLIDAKTGEHLWAETFDRAYGDIFKLQDEVSGQIIAAMKIKLTAAEKTALADLPTGNIEAYDLFLKAEAFRRTYQWDNGQRALDLYERAVTLDSTFADAYAGDAQVASYVWAYAWNQVRPRGPAALARADSSAEKALTLNPDHPLALLTLADLAARQNQFEKAVRLARWAIRTNPKNIGAQINAAFLLVSVGEHDDARRLVESIRRDAPKLLPADKFWLGQAALFLRQPAVAANYFTKALAENPNLNLIWTTLALAVSYAHMGQMDLAREHAQHLPILWTWVSYDWGRQYWSFLKDPKDADYYAEGMRLAGLPQWTQGFEAPETARVRGKELAEIYSSNVKRIRKHDLELEIKPGSWIENDKYCSIDKLSPMGRKWCWPVFRNPNVAKDGFTYAQPSDREIFRFSLVPKE